MATTRRKLPDRGESRVRRKRLGRRGYPRRPSFEPLEARTLLSTAVEAFSGYGAGALRSQNLGFGWAGSWLAPDGPNSSAATVDAPLGSLSTARSVAPSAEFQLLGGNHLESARTLAAAQAGQSAVYIAALVRVDTSGGFANSFGGIALYAGNTERFLIGEAPGSATWGIVKDGSQGSPFKGAVPIGSLTTTLLVTKIDQVHNTLTLWVNPDLLQPEAADPPALSVSFTGASDFDTVRLRAGGPADNTWQFDNIEVNSDFSPFDQINGQTDFVGQGPQTTVGGQVMGMTAQGNPVSGAIQAVGADPINPNVVFVGTVNGGVWRTDNINATRTVEPFDTNKATAPAVSATQAVPGRAATGKLAAGESYSYKIVAQTGVNQSNASDAFPLTGITLGKDADGSDQNTITLRGLPIVPAGTTLLIYRTKNGGTNYFQVDQVPGPTTAATVYQDIKADADLGAARPNETVVPFPIWTPLTDQYPTLAISSLAFDTRPPWVDGTLDPQYGPPLAVQTVGTTSKNGANDLKRANGSELDAAYGVVRNGVLYLMFTGNLKTNGSNLEVFFDASVGGGNSLVQLPPGDLSNLTGMGFSEGFRAGALISLKANADGTLAVTLVDLRNSPGVAVNLGTAGAGGPGDLNGGNAQGVKVSFNNTNVLGVAAGTDVADQQSARSVNTGIELAVPLSLIGATPGQPVRVSAVVTSPDHSLLSNQALPGLPAGTDDSLPRNKRYLNYLSVSGDATPTLYAGTGQFSSSGAGGPAVGLLKSSDGGRTFTQVGADALKDLKVTKVLAFEQTVAKGNTSTQQELVLAATQMNEARGGLFRSTDGGGTWVQISGHVDPDTGLSDTGLPAGSVSDLVSVRDPNDPSGVKRIYFAAVLPDAPAAFLDDRFAARLDERLDNGMSTTVPLLVLQAGTMDPAAWAALRDTKSFMITIGSLTVTVAPDFTGVTEFAPEPERKNNSVVERLQAALDLQFGEGLTQVDASGTAVRIFFLGRRQEIGLVRDPVGGAAASLLAVNPLTAGIYRSGDGGATWSLTAAGMQDDLRDARRVSFAVYGAETDAPVLNIGVVTADPADKTGGKSMLNGLYRSDDLGVNFRKVMNSPISGEPAIRTVVTVAATSNALDWRNLAVNPTFQLTIGDKGSLITPDVKSLPANPAPTMSDVAGKIQAAVDGVFGPNAVTVTWDGLTNRFKFASLLGLEINKLSGKGIINPSVSIFDATKAAHFNTDTNVSTVELAAALPPTTSIQVSDTFAPDWKGLGSTRSFAITIGKSTMDVTPDFGTVGTMNDVAARFQAAVNTTFGGNVVTVTYQANLRRIVFVGAMGVRDITPPGASPASLSLVGPQYASLVVGAVYHPANNPKQLVVGLSTDDPAAWTALGNNRSFEASFFGVVRPVSPDFTGVATMDDVATRVQQAITAAFSDVNGPAVTVTYRNASQSLLIVAAAQPVDQNLDSLSDPLAPYLSIFNASSDTTKLLSGTIARSTTFYGINPYGQGLTAFSIAADPTDPNRIIVGGDITPTVSVPNKSASSVGATDFVARIFSVNTALGQLPDVQAQLIGTGANGTAPHADDRSMVFDGAGNLYETDDGGIYRLNTVDASATRTWVSLNGNLAISEFSNVAQDPYSKLIFGGTQDVGSQEQAAPGSATWTSLNLGDGNAAAVAVDPVNSAVYRFSMGNNLNDFTRRKFDLNGTVLPDTDPILSKSGGPAENGSVLEGEDKKFEGFLEAAIAVNPVQPGRMLVGQYELYESLDFARTAVRVPLSDKRFDQFLTAVASGSRETNGAPAPEAAYVAAGSGIWYRSSAGGDFIGPFTPPGAGTITAIAIDPENWRVAYALDAKHLYVTIDNGQSWIDITGAAGRSGALPSDGLNSIALTKIAAPIGNKPDFRVQYADGTGFDVNLNGVVEFAGFKARVEAASMANGVKGLTVSPVEGNKIVLTGATQAVLGIIPLNDSMAAHDLHLLEATVNAATRTLTTPVLAFSSGSTLPNATLANFNNGQGVRVGTSVTDVLLVGGVDGVLRAINPLGSPAGAVYPAFDSITLRGGPNSGLTFTPRDQSLPFTAAQVTFNVTTTPGNETALVFGNNTLTFQISATTTASRIIALALNSPAVRAKYSITLAPNLDGTASDGSGFVAGGAAGTLALVSAVASATTAATGIDDTGLSFTLKNPTYPYTAPLITFVLNNAIAQGNESVAVDGANNLTFQVGPNTTANDIINLVHKDTSVGSKYLVVLSPSLNANNQEFNDGTGKVATTPATRVVLTPELATGTLGNVPNGAVAFSLKAVTYPFLPPMVTAAVANGIKKGSESVALDGNNNLTFQITATTTAADIVAAARANPSVANLFRVALVPNADGSASDGSGVIASGATAAVNLATSAATVTLRSAPNNGLTFTLDYVPSPARLPSVKFVVTDGIAVGSETVTVGGAGAGPNDLTFRINPGTTAQRIKALADGTPAVAALYRVDLAPNTDGSVNNGSGPVAPLPGGALVGIPTTADWTEFGTRLPNAQVTTIQYTPKNGALGDSLVVSTRGRSNFAIDGASAYLAVRPVLTLDADDGTGTHTLLLIRDAQNPRVLDVIADGQTVGVYQLSTIDQVAVRGHGGNDTVEVDASLFVPGGIRFDGGVQNDGRTTGSSRLVVLNNTGLARDQPGVIPGTGTVAVADGGKTLRIDYTNVKSVFAQASTDQLAALRNGFKALTFDRALGQVLAGRSVPLLGGSIGNLITGVSQAPVAHADPDSPTAAAGNADGNSNAPEVPTIGVDALGDTSSLFTELLQGGRNGFLVSQIGTMITTVDQLVAALNSLSDDSGVNHVFKTQDGKLDITVDRTFDGTAQANAAALGGLLSFIGTADYSAEAVLHLVAGIDSRGFFIDPTSFSLTLSHIQIKDGLSATGRVGFLGVDVSDATLVVDPAVQVQVTMKDPGVDPVTGIDDGRVRPDELTAYAPTALYAVSVASGTANRDVVLTAHFDVGAIIPGADAPFTIAGADVQLTWPNATQPTNVTIAAAPGSLGGGLLEQFLSFNTHDFISGLASAADFVQALTGQDILATKLPLINTTLGDLINANPAPLTFSGDAGNVAGVSEPASDGTTERFVVTLSAGLTPLPRQGVKVGDKVVYKTADANGDKLDGTIDAMGDGWFSVTYAAALDQAPNRAAPSFVIKRTSSLGDLLRELVGDGINVPATSVKVDTSQFTLVSSSASRSSFTLNSGVTPLLSQGVVNGDQVVLQTTKGGWITGTIGDVNDGLFGFDLRLVSWGDGSGLPTSGRKLVIAGTDNTGLLHIRIFDANGSVTNTDETQLPGTQRGAISELKAALPGLLSPYVLTAADKARWLDKVSSIVGQTPGFSVSNPAPDPNVVADFTKSIEIEFLQTTGGSSTPALRVPTLQDLVRGIGTELGYSPDQVDQALQVSFDPATFVLSMTPTFAPDPLVFTHTLDFGSAIPGLAFDATGTVTATITPRIHLPIRIDLSANKDLEDRFYLVNDGMPDLSLGVKLSIDNPNFGAQIGLLGLRVANSQPGNKTYLDSNLNVTVVDPAGPTGDGHITVNKLLDFDNLKNAFQFAMSGNLNIDGLTLTPDAFGEKLPFASFGISIDGNTDGKIQTFPGGEPSLLDQLRALPGKIKVRLPGGISDFRNLSPGDVVSLLIQVGDTLQSIASKLDVPGGIPYVRDAASQVVNFSQAVTTFARKLYFPPVLAAGQDMQLPDAGLPQGTGIFVQVESGAPVFVPVAFDGASTLQGVIDGVNAALARVGLGGKLMAVLQGSRFTLTTVEGAPALGLTASTVMVTAPVAPAAVRLGNDLSFQVVVNGIAIPVALRATDTAENLGIADLAASLDAALRDAGIDSKVRATSSGGVLVIGSVDPTVTTLAVKGAAALGFADGQSAAVNPAAAALGLGAGTTVTASFRFNSIQAFVGELNKLIAAQTQDTGFDAHLVYLPSPPSIQFNFKFKADFVRGTQLAFDRGVDIGLGTLNFSAAADASFKAAASFSTTLGIDLNPVGKSNPNFTANTSLASLNNGQGVDVLAGLTATGDAPTNGRPNNGDRALSFDVLTIDAGGAERTRRISLTPTAADFAENQNPDDLAWDLTRLLDAFFKLPSSASTFADLIKEKDTANLPPVEVAVSAEGKLQLVSHSRLIHLLTIIQGAGYGFGAGQVSNEPDLKVTLRDGSQFTVVIAGARTLGDVQRAIQDAAPKDSVRLDLDPTQSRLELVDLTAQSPGNRFKVEAWVTASRYVIDLSKGVIDLPDRTSPAAADLGLEGEVPDTFTLTFTDASGTPFTTAPIVSDATGRDVLDALGLALDPQGLPAGRDAFVSVTGNPGGPFTVVFAPGLGAVNDLIYKSDTGMTAAVKTTVPGRRGSDTSAVSAVQVITPSPAARGTGVTLVGSTLNAGPLSDQFYVLAGSGMSINAEIKASNINLTASLGLLSFQIKNGGADFTVNAGLTLGPVAGRGDNKVRLSDLLDSGILGAITPTFAYGGSGTLPVDTSLLPFLPSPRPNLAVNFALRNQSGSLKPNFTLDVANFDKFLGSFRNLSAGQIVDALRKLVSVVQNSNLPGLNTKIPLINKTPNEVLGIADGILQAGNDFLNGPDYAALQSISNDMAAQVSAVVAALQVTDPSKAEALSRAYSVFAGAVDPTSTYMLRFQKADGTTITTAPIAYNENTTAADLLDALRAILSPAAPSMPAAPPTATLPRTVQFDVSGLFNRNVVRTPSDHLRVPLDAHLAFMTSDPARKLARGLPANGFFPETASHPAVQLGWSNSDRPDSKNALVLDQPGNVNVFFLPASQQGSFQRIQIYATSANGPTTIQVVLQYLDRGPNGVNNFVVDDWSAGGPRSTPSGFNLASGLTPWNVSGGFAARRPSLAIYGYNIAVDPTRTLTGFYINKISGGSLVFFGATAERTLRPPVPSVTDVFNGAWVVPMDLTGSYNRDVVKKPGANPATAADANGNLFATQSKLRDHQLVPSSKKAVGLPDDGFFPGNADHPDVALDWSNANAVFLDGKSPSFSFQPPAPASQYQDLQLYATSAGGPSNLRVTLEYADGTQQLVDLKVDDWQAQGRANVTRYPQSFVLASGLNGWNLHRHGLSGDGNGHYADYAIYGYNVYTQPFRTLVKVGVQKTGGDGHAMIFGATGLTSVAMTPPPTVQMDLSRSFNRDVVRTTGKRSANLSPVVNGLAFVTDAQAKTVPTRNVSVFAYKGLPDDGRYAADANHPAVQLGWSNANAPGTDNVVFLDQAATSFTFRPLPTRYQDLQLYATSAGGPSGVQLTLEYADGTKQTEDLSVDDWTAPQQGPGMFVLDSGLNTWIVGAGSINAGSTASDNGTVSIYGDTIPTDPLLTLVSVTVEKPSAQGALMVFGATGRTVLGQTANGTLAVPSPVASVTGPDGGPFVVTFDSSLGKVLPLAGLSPSGMTVGVQVLNDGGGGAPAQQEISFTRDSRLVSDTTALDQVINDPSLLNALPAGDTPGSPRDQLSKLVANDRRIDDQVPSLTYSNVDGRVGPSGSLGDRLARLIKDQLKAVDPNVDVGVTIDVKNAAAAGLPFQPALVVGMHVGTSVTGHYPFDLSLANYGPIDVNAGGNIDVTIGGTVDVGMGLNLATLTPYVMNTTQAQLHALVNAPVTLEGSVGPIKASLDGALLLAGGEQETHKTKPGQSLEQLTLKKLPVNLASVVVSVDGKVLRQGSVLGAKTTDYVVAHKNQKAVIEFKRAQRGTIDVEYLAAGSHTPASISLGLNKSIKPSDNNVIGGVPVSQFVASAGVSAAEFLKHFSLNVNAIAAADIAATVPLLKKGRIEHAVTAAASLNQLTTQVRFDGLKDAVDNLLNFQNLDLHQIIAGARAFVLKLQDGLMTQSLQQLPLVGTLTDLPDTTGYDFRWMSQVNNASLIPDSGNKLFIVTSVNGVLYFRIFDASGKMIVDTNEANLTTKAAIAGLKSQLLLLGANQPSPSQKAQFITAVNSIVAQIPFIADILRVLDSLDSGIGAFSGHLNRAAEWLRGQIFNRLGPGSIEGVKGFDILDPTIKKPDDLIPYIRADFASLSFLFQLPLAHTDTFHASFDLGLNALAFGFSANGGVTLTLNYHTVLGFGLDKPDGFYIAVNPNATYLPGKILPSSTGAQPEMQFQVTAALDPNSTLAAQLFFLHVTASNVGPTSLGGTVFVDLIDPNNDGKLTLGEIASATQLGDVFNAGIETEAKANLALKADVADYPQLPNVSSGFTFDWSLGYSIRTGVVGGGLPLVQFTNVTLDLGSFLAEVIQPFLVDFNTYAQPIKPLVEFLNTEVPGLSDVSKQAGKGPITYMQLGVLLANGPSGVNADAYRRAQVAQSVLNLLAQAFQLAEDASSPDFLGTDKTPLMLKFGTFTFGGPGNAVNLADKNTTVSADQATQTGTVDTLQTALEKAAAANDPNVRKEGALLASLTRAPDGSGNNGLGISLPFLKNPSLLMKMFTGETADLVTWDIPKLVLNLPYYQQFGPLFGLPLFATVGINFTAFLDLHLGFDTRGLAPPAGSLAAPVDSTSGSTATVGQPTTLDKFVNGFYFGAPINPQTNLPFPVFGLALDVSVGAKLESYFASVGAEGAIIGLVSLSWNDIDRNGKVYLDELINLVKGNFASNAGGGQLFLAVFNAQGSVTAVLRITYSVFLFSGKFDLINKTLLSFDTSTGTVICGIC